MLLHQYMNGALEVMHPTALQKDTTFTKIFVGGLPYHTNDASLRKYFEAFGDIDEAVVITDRQTGKSRGYGFVSTSSDTLGSHSQLLKIRLCHAAFSAFSLLNTVKSVAPSQWCQR